LANFLGGFSNKENVSKYIKKLVKLELSSDHASSTFARQGIFFKDFTVWMDGARLANTCILPYFLGNTPTQLSGVPTIKSFMQLGSSSKHGANCQAV
jgi:hypothetical protein